MKRLAVIIGFALFFHAATLSAQGQIAQAGQTVSFAKPIISDLGGPFLANITAGDINADGFSDLAVTYNIFGVPPFYALGTGDGHFPTWGSAPGTVSPAWVVLADMNGDGNLDLLTSDANYGYMTIAFGDGNGNFPSSEQLNTAYLDSVFAVADLNNDGVPDIVGIFHAGAKGYPGGVDVVLGLGNGQFQPEMHFPSGAFDPNFVAVGDLNHDGIPDLVVANFGGSRYGSVTVLLGRGDGTFLPPVRYRAGKYPTSLVLADFNGDGNLDIAVTGFSQHTISILFGDGKGGFSPPTTVFVGRHPTAGIVVADFNGDGKQDLAVIDEVSTSQVYILVLLGNGDGTFQRPQYFPTGGDSIQMVAADFNGDGKPDLATVNSTGYVNGTVSVLINTTQ